MKKFLVATAIFLLLSCSYIFEANWLRGSKAPSRNSRPFSDILLKAKQLMGEQNANQVNDQLNSLKQMSQEQIVDYFANHKYSSVQDYWFQYYLLSELLLFTDSNTWVNPAKQQINDPFYNKLVENDEAYAQDLQKCRDQSNHFITQKQHEQQETKDKKTLYDLEYNYETLESINQDIFYNYIYKNLPKGVIHHIHESSDNDYQGLINSIQDAINSQPYDSERIVVVSANLFLEDASVGKVPTEKHYYKYFLTKQKYIDPSKFKQFAQENKEILAEFQENVMEKQKCLNYIKDNNGFDPSDLDPFIRGFVYWYSCNGSIYDKGMHEQKQAKSMEDLSNMLKKSMACFQSDEQAIKRLPKSYLRDNDFESKQNKEILGIWFFFEQIFQSLDELQDNSEIYQNLNTNMFKKLSEQKTYGVEFRNSNDRFEIETFEKNSEQFEIPFSYITFGKKSAARSSYGGYIVQSAQNITDPHFAGIDFVAFEDDPYDGARNFFPEAFTDIQQGQTESYFDQMFNYLNNQNGKIFLHAGETKQFLFGVVDDTYTKKNYINDNLIHAALLPGVKRIGHGFEAYKNNLLLSIINQKNISFEISPISNQILKYYNITINPLLNLLRKGMHVTISPDDPGFYGYMGVSMDWYYLLMETDIKPSEVYLLLKNSIEYSSIEEIKENSDQQLKRLRDDLIQFFNNLKQLYQKEILSKL